MTDLTNLPLPVDPNDPAELLSLIPYHYGFQLEESAVFLAVCVDWRRMRLGPLSKSDLRRLAVPETAAELRGRFMSNLPSGAAWEGHIAIFTDDLFGALATRELQPQAIERRADRMSQELARWYDLPGFHPTRTYIVGPESWRCLACRDPGHCSPEGYPRAALGHTCIATWMRLRGRRYAPSSRALIDVSGEAPPAAVDERVHRELRRLRRFRADPRPLPWQEVTTRKWRAALGCIRAGEAGNGRPAPADLGLLALSLHSVPIRDNIIYAICTGREVPAPGASDAHFAAMFQEGLRLDPGKMGACLDFLEVLAEHCPARFRAPILAVWAWCHWWIGQVAHANILVDLALETDGRYSLAYTLQRVLETKMSPPWVSEG